MMMKKLGVVVLLWSVLQAGVWAGFDEGVIAADRGDYATALKEWQPLAEAGDTRAQYGIGFLYQNGNGVPKNTEKAEELFRIVFNKLTALVGQGDSETQFQLGMMYMSGHGTLENTNEGSRLIKLAADQGNAKAQTVVAGIYASGNKGLPKSYTEALKWYKRSANQGLAAAQLSIGEMYQYGRGVPKNGAEAVKWYRLAASQGLINAKFELGHLYGKGGVGVPKNNAEAVKWFQRAANQGGVAAKKRLGSIYEHGQDVPKNYTEAARWYKMAADEGDAEAQTKLGYFYEEGQGVPKRYTEAVRWYRLAADQGYIRAQYHLGLMYDRGEGVPKSHEEAVRWLEMSADNDDSSFGSAARILTLIYESKARSNVRDDLMSVDFMEAIKWHRRIISRHDYYANNSKQKLAEAYAEGRGVEKNIVIAYALYNFLAVESEDMAQKRDSLDFGSSENRLTPEQRRTAQAISVKLQNSDDFLRTLDEAVQQTTGK